MLPGFKMLATAINGNKIILIWVDSDADGYTSAASLVNYLHNLFPVFTENNIIFKFHKGKEHGIIADEIPDSVGLVIAPDSSSNDYEEHKKLKERGIDVLVIDHHEAEKVSEDACVSIISYVITLLSHFLVLVWFTNFVNLLIPLWTLTMLITILTWSLSV